MATKKVQTVLGLINPDELGFTLTHEHLSMNVDEFIYVPPTNPKDLHLGEAKLDSNNYQWISQNPVRNRDNLTLNDANAEIALIEELKVFKANGGGTIVDQSSIGLNRKHSFLKKLAIETKVNVVAGAGFYTHKNQSKVILGHSVEQLAEIIRQQMVPSLQNDDNILCGVIGEVGLESPIHEFEKKSIRASAIIQSELNCPVLFHPPTNCKDTLEAIRIYEEAGGRTNKLVIAHLDWPNAREETLRLADENKTIYLEFDTFGTEKDVYGLPPFVTDQQRIDLIKLLVKEGYENRIVLSHDLWAKHKLIHYGGHGYCHLIRSVPKLMIEQGLTTQQIHKFTVENPKNWLVF